MSKLSEAVDSIKQYAERNRGIMLLADALTELNSIEDATAAANAQRDDALRALDSAKVDLDKAHKDLATTCEQNEKTKERVQSDIAAAIAAANHQAEDIVVRGRADAANLLENASKDAEARMSAAQAIVEDLNAKADERREELQVLNEKVDDATQRLDEIEDKIAALKQTAQSVLG